MKTFQEERLRLQLSEHLSKEKVLVVAEEAMADRIVLDVLIKLVCHGEEPIRWRATWALEQICSLCPSVVYGERSVLVQLTMQREISERMLRLLLGILYRLPDDKIFNVAFYNLLLDKMCNLQSSSGVQSLSMKLAYRMSRIDADLHREFLGLVRNMELDYYSSGVKATARNCLKAKLGKIKRRGPF